MKAAKWREMSERRAGAEGARSSAEELFNLRFQLSMGVAKNPSRVGQAKRDLARSRRRIAAASARALNIRAVRRSVPRE